MVNRSAKNTGLPDAAPDAASNAAANALLGAHDAVGTTVTAEEAAAVRAERQSTSEGFQSLWKATPNDPARPGPKRAGHLTIRKYLSVKSSKEVVLGSLWKDRLAVVFMLPDIKSISCRDMLVAAAIIQVHLQKLGVGLCLIFPVSNPKHAQDVCDDFGLNLSNVEIYSDTSKDYRAYEEMGLFPKSKVGNKLQEAPTVSQRLEELGYYLLRGCWGPSTNAICCINGFGFSNNCTFWGGVIMLGPSDNQIRYKCYDEDGTLKVDTHTIMAQASRMALSVAQGATADVFVPV
mmetsp:Transcript_44378/g.105785  ORF Transcript_44378/g.105785 Transcript_44378/m.105785 type:complete len:291 (+) Transcript_44378:89-961(+)